MMSFFTELLAYVRVRKKVWLLPAILFLIFLGFLLVFSQGSVFAPFIYTLY